MEKQKLWKLKRLEATDEMLELAGKDIPIITNVPYEKMEYPTGLYVRTELEDNILKVGIFFAEILASGGRRPSYTLFINPKKECFTSYDYRLKRWTDRMLDKLDFPKGVNWKHTWCASDCQERIWKAIGNKYKDENVYLGILEYQEHLRRKKRLEKHRKRTDAWDRVMKQVHETPKDWNRWVRKVGITQNFVFYQYSRKKETTGYCTWCEKEIPIKKPKHNQKGTCPNCRHQIRYKAIGRQRRVRTEQETSYLLQTCGDGLVIREFIASAQYDMLAYNKPVYHCWEQRRFVYDEHTPAGTEYYMGYYQGTNEHRWICGVLERYSPYFGGWKEKVPCYEGRIYQKSLHGMENKIFKRSGFYEYLGKKETAKPVSYFCMLSRSPYLEQLVKAGLGSLVKQLMEKKITIDYKKSDSLGHALGIDKFRLDRLRNNNGDYLFLQWLRYEKKHEQVIKDDVITWLAQAEISPEQVTFILNRMRPEQIKNYLKKQSANSRKTPKELVDTWKDYLGMALRLGMDVNDAIVFRVNKLEKRHNEVVQMIKDKGLALKACEIVQKFPDIDFICQSLKKYEYKYQNFQIVAPQRVEDILEEGSELKHCITGKDTYYERIAKRESYLLFLRKTEAHEKPYYTLEVEPNGTVRQKRTYYDRQNADIEQAKVFLLRWQKQLTKKLNKEDKILAFKSRDLRKKEIEELRKNKVKVNGFGYQGKLLADILEEDLMEAAA